MTSNTIKILYISIIFIMFFSLNSYAQIDKKTFFIGGDFRFWQQKSKHHTENFDFKITYEDKFEDLYVEPQIGYFLSKNLAFGIRLGYIKHIHDYKNNSSSSDYTIIRKQKFLKPFLKYYKIVHNKFGFWSSLAIAKGTNKFETKEYNFNREGSFYDLELKTGIIYYATKKLGIEARIGSLEYYTEKERVNDNFDIPESQHKKLNITFDMSSISIGIYCFL